MADQDARLEVVRRYWDHAGADVELADEIYHEDAVLEFPQSGERFEGRAGFTEWRSRYPGDVRYRVRRITARDDLVVCEVSVTYDGESWMLGVQLLEFRGDAMAGALPPAYGSADRSDRQGARHSGASQPSIT